MGTAVAVLSHTEKRQIDLVRIFKDTISPEIKMKLERYSYSIVELDIIEKNLRIQKADREAILLERREERAKTKVLKNKKKED